MDASHWSIRVDSLWTKNTPHFIRREVMIESRFHLQVTGPKSGRKWIFLHGLMGYARNWRGIIGQLEVSECCLAFDQRGHGRSYHPESGYAPKDYANDLLEIANHLGWDEFVLVGHSLGARTALEFALTHPERLTHLVIEDMGPQPPEEAKTKFFHELLAAIPVPFSSREAAKSFFANEFPKLPLIQHSSPALSAFLFANLRETEDGSWNWQFSRRGILESVESGWSFDRWCEMSQLKVKTLVIRGENSLDLTRAAFDKMLTESSMISGVEIAGAGHWVHFDQPKKMVEELKRFVAVE